MGADDNRGMNTPFAADGAVMLSHLGVIRARGEDAASFLQSQLTSDVAGLGPGKARLAGFCSAKGRLQASFMVWKRGADEVLLACSADLLPATLKRLSMFVMRAKCKLSDASGEIPLTGFIGRSADGLAGNAMPWAVQHGAQGQVLRLPDARSLPRCIVAPMDVPVGIDKEVSLDTWRWLEVQSGIPTIQAATVDQFVPQMLNFELLGGVDFQKGCYPGQEVVARSQYRGTIKRRMSLFALEVPAAPGQEIFHDGDPAQPAGMVVNAAPDPSGGWSVLAETKLAALEGGRLHLGSPEGAELRLGELPYTVVSMA
jgi:folate-binding protein YgfZ